MDEDARTEVERLTREVERLMADPEMREEGIRQDRMIHGGLIGFGIIMVQPFLTSTSLDRSATICVVAWSVAIPLLAALVLVNRHETFRRRRTGSRIVVGARPLAMAAAFAGLVAGFWHVHWVAGVAVLASALVATGVHSAGFTRLELGTKPEVE